MSTMNISLPESMRNWVDERLKTGLYANNSDYIRDLVRKDQLQTEKLTAMQRAITAGVESTEAGKLNMQTIKQKTRHQAGLSS